MLNVANRGFILPACLILGAALLLLGGLAVENALMSGERRGRDRLEREAGTALSTILAGIHEKLEEDLFEKGYGSAERLPVEGNSVVRQTAFLDPSDGETGPLHSKAVGMVAERVRFRSAAGAMLLEADSIPLPGTSGSASLDIAWTAEDLSISATEDSPAFWPLPGWQYCPEPDRGGFREFMETSTLGRWQDGPWIDGGEALPMEPEDSPAMVPVVRNLSLRFGIFASGPARQREKTVRLRFFIGGEVWNPYNRPMQLHPGKGLHAVMRVVFWNLPMVRIRNLANGVSTGWIQLDRAANGVNGNRGLHGWIRLPGTLGPGQSLRFLEPDPDRQAEGLARTLHGGFMVGPADPVEIEFLPDAAGLQAACLVPDGREPLAAAAEGEGWHRLEGFASDWPKLMYPRADYGPRPFLLEGGSLSFRLENCRLAVSLQRTGARLKPVLDPRQRRIRADQQFRDAAGSLHSGESLVRLEVEDLEKATVKGNPRADAPAAVLFSWPDKLPENLLEASDLASWEEGYQIGAAGALEINRVLDEDWAWRGMAGETEPVLLGPAGGNQHAYTESLHINGRSVEMWERALLKSRSSTGSHAAFANVDAASTADFRKWNSEALHQAAEALSGRDDAEWAASVSSFFSGGAPGRAFAVAGGPPYPHALMPLRGWLRNAPVPRSHGPAWVVHVAVRAQQLDSTVIRSARLWLLEARDTQGKPYFERIRFEWADPERHLMFLSR